MTNLPERDALRLMLRDTLPLLAETTDEQMLIESLMELPDVSEGVDIAGSTMAPPTLMRLDVTGFPTWRRAVGATPWAGDGT